MLNFLLNVAAINVLLLFILGTVLVGFRMIFDCSVWGYERYREFRHNHDSWVAERQRKREWEKQWEEKIR